jgi:hypothetical protein
MEPHDIIGQGFSGKDLIIYVLFVLVGAFAKSFGAALTSLPDLKRQVKEMQDNEANRKKELRTYWSQLDQVKSKIEEAVTIARSKDWDIDKPDWHGGKEE